MPDTTPHPAVPCTIAETAEPLFDAERLDVYRVALDFQTLATTLVPRRGQATLRDQLDRASVSIALNIDLSADRQSAGRSGSAGATVGARGCASGMWALTRRKSAIRGR
jgi:hypothetical protein